MAATWRLHPYVYFSNLFGPSSSLFIPEKMKSSMAPCWVRALLLLRMEPLSITLKTQVSFVHLDDEIHVDNIPPEDMLVTADELPEAPSIGSFVPVSS